MVADYILHKAKLSPDFWTVSSGTVGSQRQSSGEQTNFPFCSWKATNSITEQKKMEIALFRWLVLDKLRKDLNLSSLHHSYMEFLQSSTRALLLPLA